MYSVPESPIHVSKSNDVKCIYYIYIIQGLEYGMRFVYICALVTYQGHQTTGTYSFH